MISRKHFTSAASHRVCSLHFAGVKETNLNNASTIVPNTVKPIAGTPTGTLNSTRVLAGCYQI